MEQLEYMALMELHRQIYLQHSIERTQVRVVALLQEHLEAKVHWELR